MHSENRNPCVFPGQIGGVNRSLDMQGLRNKGACVIKSWLSHIVCRIFNTSHVCTLLQIVTDVHLFQVKTTRHVENEIMMFNHAGFSDNALF